MVGITTWGSYIPYWRLDRSSIGAGLKGEKAIAGYDEDNITMAVAAAVDCLTGLDRKDVDGLFFATTTSPYAEKLGATIIAAAVDLRRDILTADFTNSLRAGTGALKAATDAVKAGSANQILVVASDCRLGAPGSTWESSCGDGAAAFLVGESEDAVAEMEAFYSLSDEIVDVWRLKDDRFIRSAEGRFIANEGFMRVSHEAITGLLKDFHLSKEDFSKAVIGLPNPKTQALIAKAFGFDPKTQAQDPMFFQMGETGAAYPLMLLQAALEDANGGDRFLLLSYGSGSDAMSLKVNEDLKSDFRNRGIKWHLSRKRTITDYKTYARWREILPVDKPPNRLGVASPPAYLREVDQNIRLYGVKCKACGTLQYPPQRVCTKCHEKDQFESVRFSDKKARLFTYSIDYVTWALEMPLITAVINFEGGGRMERLMTDAADNEVKVDMALEMSFRKLDVRDGINTYAWKCIPLR